ncbi:SDR family oxidoreductase [Catenulispora sp. EB89]|uniref:SDR family oxidoreductase n=1 Tax=Catenulispora sp. EB89 TaxID=3156257 RepID=UPI003518FAA5
MSSPDLLWKVRIMSTNTTAAATAATTIGTTSATDATATPARPLAGRVAVITGASSGIGEASALELAALGARVVVLARRAERLAELVERVEKDGGQALAITADVTDRAAVQAAADRVAAEFGGADLLFNNAGVMLPAPIEEVATGQWQHQIDLNITGLMNVIGAFVPQLVAAAAERGVADLVNTSSIAAQNIFPGFAVYCGTKAYVTHMSRQLRAELGAKNVRVAAIEPGIVGTELQTHVTDAGAQAWLEGAAQTMEFLTPGDIAQTVGFLAALPPRVNLQQVTIMPTGQPS